MPAGEQVANLRTGSTIPDVTTTRPAARLRTLDVVLEHVLVAIFVLLGCGVVVLEGI